MTGLIYQGKPLPIVEGETVLDCLTRHELEIASSCRAGVCQSCLVQGKGPVPPVAQRGLKASLVARGFFLACQCPAEEGLEVVSAESLPSLPVRVISRREFAPGVIELKVEKPAGLEFEAGQFLHLIRPQDGLTRSYSVASLPSAEHLEFHVAVLPGGRMSSYLASEECQKLHLRGPGGDCFYLGKDAEEPLLLVGTGTGLAPLVGVVRAALAAEHQGPIHLLHGARDADGLYLGEALSKLAGSHENLSYAESTLSGAQSDPKSDLFSRVKSDFSSLTGFRVYLCGNPDFVQKMKKQCFLAGAAMQAIHSDPFVLAPS